MDIMSSSSYNYFIKIKRSQTKIQNSKQVKNTAHKPDAETKGKTGILKKNRNIHTRPSIV